MISVPAICNRFGKTRCGSWRTADPWRTRVGRRRSAWRWPPSSWTGGSAFCSPRPARLPAPVRCCSPNKRSGDQLEGCCERRTRPAAWKHQHRTRLPRTVPLSTSLASVLLVPLQSLHSSTISPYFTSFEVWSAVWHKKIIPKAPHRQKILII
jgi:hypothetical protein